MREHLNHPLDSHIVYMYILTLFRAPVNHFCSTPHFMHYALQRIALMFNFAYIESYQAVLQALRQQLWSLAYS